MTIETSPANNLFAGFNDDEKKMLAVAVRRVEELEETRRITAGMAGQAQSIEAGLKARGVTDSDVLREAAEAVSATQGAQASLGREVHDYRKLFGPDGKASAAVGQYVQLLRNAHTGDANALNKVQSARRELYEARDASAAHREVSAEGRWAGIENSAERADPARTRKVEIERTEEEKQRLLDPDQRQLRQGVTLVAALATALPSSFAGKYVKDGNKVVEVGNAKHVILVDKGTTLQIPRDFDAESVKATIDVAEARRWNTMKVAGDEKFRQAAWLEGVSRGIHVQGYKASEAEQQWAQQQAEKRGKVNTVTENEAVKAFHSARTPAERSKASEQHPELKKAFAIEASYAHLAKEIQPKTSQEAFMHRMRDNIATDLAQGRELADVRLRKPFKQREYSRVQDREQDRSR